MEINISSNCVGNKSPHHHHHVSSQQTSPEESTWTMYFEEYFAHKNDIHQNQLHPFSFGCDDNIVDHHHATSSVVSDAASSASGKSLAAAGLLSRKRLGYKKRNNKSYNERVFMVEDDLQDTACSPKRNRGNRSKGKREGFREIMGSMEGRGIITIDDTNTSKQKKGFCLVPLSMELNYLQ